MSASLREPFDERESWSEERWRAFQWERLRDVVELAATSLPFYRERLAAAGIAPGEFRSWDDLARIPLTTKADVIAAMRERRSHHVGMEASEPDGALVLGMTTGTVGTAILEFPEEWRRATGDAAARAYWWAGLRAGMSMLVAAPGWHCMSLRQSYVAARIGARCVTPWGSFLPRFAGGYLDAIADLRPAFVCLFLPMIHALIAECRARRVSAGDAFARVETILVGGAPLTTPGRRALERELGVERIFDSAGSSEGLLAAECGAHDGMHYFVDICHIDVIDPATRRSLPAGRRGTVVLTSLAPHGSIHLRYDTGDVGEILAGECACGSTWPRIRIYDRRANTVTVGGRELLWYDVRRCVDEIPDLVSSPCAIVRDSLVARTLTVMVQRPARGDVERIEGRLREILMDRLRVPLAVEWTRELPSRWKGVAILERRDVERHDG